MLVKSLKRVLVGCVVAAGLAVVPVASAQVTPRPETPTQSAQRQIREANAAVVAATAQLKAARVKIVEAFKQANPDMAKAEADLAEAKKEADTLQAEVQKQIQGTAEYQQAQAGKDSARAKLAELAAKNGSPLARDSATQEYTRHAMTLSRLDRAAEADPKVRAARTRVAEAQRALDGFNAQIDQAALADPEYAAADQAVQAAQQAVLTANEGLKQAIAQERESRRTTRIK
jgi:hypothetical protein